MSRAETVANILELAALRVEQGWTRHVDAKNAMGTEVPPTMDSACYFCADGAIQAAAMSLIGAVNAGVLMQARRLVCDVLGFSPVEVARSAVNAWNDGQSPCTGQADVAQTLRDAAQRVLRKVEP